MAPDKFEPAATPVVELQRRIILHYSSGWKDAFIHFNMDKKGKNARSMIASH